MKALDIDYSIKDSIIMYSAATFAGSITPGYVGDFIKILYLKKDGYPFGKSFSSILLDRLFDVISIIMLGLAGSLLIYQVYKGHATSFSVIFLLVIAFIMIMATVAKWKNSAKIIINYICDKVLPYKHNENFGNHFDDVCSSFSVFSVKSIFFATLLTFIGWTINFVMAYLVALSIHLHVSFLYLSTCVALSTLVAFIPVSISGIGTRDATLVILFSFIGYSMESAIAFSMARFILYLINVGMTLIAWLINPIDLSTIRKNA
jgi:hypothetical protein